MPKESETQARIFTWAAYMRGKYPELELMYHVPNGGSRNIREAANLKRQGVKAGVPDICLPVPRGGYHGLYIELKEGRNKASEKQLEWIENLTRQGYVAAVCSGFDAAVKEITGYLEGANYEHIKNMSVEELAEISMCPNDCGMDKMTAKEHEEVKKQCLCLKQ